MSVSTTGRQRVGDTDFTDSLIHNKDILRGGEHNS
jgi:hypothetical protein